VFANANGTPHRHRNVTRRSLHRTATIAGIDNDQWPLLRYHDLRHTFASQVIPASG
jgi:site-specific recombinase XerC